MNIKFLTDALQTMQHCQKQLQQPFTARVTVTNLMLSASTVIWFEAAVKSPQQMSIIRSALRTCLVSTFNSCTTTTTTTSSSTTATPATTPTTVASATTTKQQNNRTTPKLLAKQPTTINHKPKHKQTKRFQILARHLHLLTPPPW